MNMEASYTIDLEQYGASGQVVMTAPSLSRMTAMNNALWACARRFQKKGEPIDMTNVPLGDLAIISVLAYIKSAPFKTTQDDFMRFCDELDEKRNGSASELLKRMQECMTGIDKGEVSPLEDSPRQETQSSD